MRNFLLFLFIQLLTGNSAFANELKVTEGQFHLTRDDGRVYSGEQLVGARLAIAHGGKTESLLIKDAELRPLPGGKSIWLYNFFLESDTGSDPKELCVPDAQGRTLGLPIEKEGRIDLTCTSGAEGKCILLGYTPWGGGSGIPMADLHQACIHMIRADYGGDGRATTRDGTIIDVYDNYGIQTSATDQSMTLEAAWGASGAVCVAHPRIAQNISLRELAERYPLLRGSLGEIACTEDAVRNNQKVLIYNRSLER